jgi:tetratricopeptide (TPR) repeat protein
MAVDRLPAGDGAFADLRRLSDWFVRASSRSTVQLDRITRRLGATAVPLLGRELRGADPARREAAREALATLATDDRARARVLVELRSVTAGKVIDEAKVCALGLLAELGEHGAAKFSDPSAIQRRSALALAAQLETAADVASAADLMVHQLDDGDVVQMLELLASASPGPAYRLAHELMARLDVAAEQRARIAALVSISSAPELATARRTRSTRVAVLVDAAARIVVVASRKVSGERRWRRWAVLIGASGRVDDCLHEDDANDDGDLVIANLCADGYRVASTELDHARTVVTSAVRLAAIDPARLTSAYYLGRDLLDLEDAHIARNAEASSDHPTDRFLGHALELLAAGEPARARAILERHTDVETADTAGALGACMLAQGETAAAIAPLERAIAGEPTWPLHHWNLATALHLLGDSRGCYHALRRFVATSANPSGLYGDPDQPGRVACAERMLAEIERTARLTGTSLRRRKKTRARR